MPNRYLIRFDARRTPHYFTDLLILGAGIAGLRAALEVPADLDVLVVAKEPVELSNSSWAQGGIAGVMSPEDKFENHIEDTIAAGGGLCHPDVVERVCREAPEQIGQLIGWDTHFDEEEGKIALTREGGHSHRRIVHALGDSTGFEVMRALGEKVRHQSNLTLWEDAFTLDLLTHEGRCVGCLVWRTDRGPILVWAKQTILASGGAGMVYRETTNPNVTTGDGMGAAYRAGAQLRDMEFMQFHPTVLYVAGSSRFLISEAVRGEGAYLRDKSMHRFMLDADPRAELAPRDVVAQAIVRQMELTKHPNVFLDLRHLDKGLVRRRFPGIDKMCRKFGLDITSDLIPIRPGAHYMIGGVVTDIDGKTTLPGLWAAGEVTSTGLHGANRLASNSLLEGMVFGAACGRGAAEVARTMASSLTALPLANRFAPEEDGFLDVADLTNSLKSLMVRRMGVIRDEPGLADATETIEFWCRYVLPREFSDRAGWELQNLLTVARLMVDSARRRLESRGVHFRSDHPQPEEAWRRHLVSPPLEEMMKG